MRPFGSVTSMLSIVNHSLLMRWNQSEWSRGGFKVLINWCNLSESHLIVIVIASNPTDVCGNPTPQILARYLRVH